MAAHARFYAGQSGAIELAQRAVDLSRDAGNPLVIAEASFFLALVLTDEAPERALALLEANLATVLEPGHEIGAVLSVATTVGLHLQDWELAFSIAYRALWAARWASHELAHAQHLATCARGDVAVDPETAGVLVGATYAAARRGSDASARDSVPPPSRAVPWVQALRDTHAIVVERLGPERANELRSRGLRMELPQAIDYAIHNTNPTPVLALLQSRSERR